MCLGNTIGRLADRHRPHFEIGDHTTAIVHGMGQAEERRMELSGFAPTAANGLPASGMGPLGTSYIANTGNSRLWNSLMLPTDTWLLSEKPCASPHRFSQFWLPRKEYQVSGKVVQDSASTISEEQISVNGRHKSCRFSGCRAHFINVL